MALHLHRSDRPAALADGLAELLAAQPLDVFERELVIAPSPGVERWLTQRLSHHLGAARGHDGVCAGLDVRTPWSFMSMLLGREFDDPWHPDRLAWPVLTAIDACVERPGFETLAHHLGADALAIGEDAWSHRARQSRRYAVARRLAGLFASYADERPDLMRAWERGENSAGEQAEDLSWQAPLWRATLEAVAASNRADSGDASAGDAAVESPVARLDRVVMQLREGTLEHQVPPRLSFFGYTRVSAAMLDLLEATAVRHEVHLWLPHPSDALWQALSGRAEVARRADDTSASAAHHPLLATLGRDVRELEAVLTTRQAMDEPIDRPLPGSDSSPPAPATTTRLAQMQADIRANRVPSGSPTITESLSFQVHACHGAARQVEALRETLLWLLDEGAGRLQPRDILVMCPDVETYAPLIKAAFAATADDERVHPGRRLRVQLADRGVAATNPLAEVALRLVSLVTGRVTATEVLDFAGLPAVRERFGFTDESFERITRWVKESGARWGLDGRHRGEYGIGAVTENTWATALDRLALGVTMSMDTDAPAVDHQPIDDLGSSDIVTASAFVTLLEEVTAAAHEIRGSSVTDPALPRASFTADEWFAWLRRHVVALAAPAQDAAWQLGQFERELAFLQSGAGDRTALRVTDVRIMLEQRWASRPTRSNFRNGAISVCTLTPMRSVPHKAVIVLGLDDAAFPRSQVVDGDDVLARDPRVGERDPRSEDRQLLLDAVMASEEYFIAFYSGFDERDGTRRPPAVPLQELIAAAAATGGTPPPTADDAPPSFVREHPLQAFDERNFLPPAEASDGGRNPLPGGSYDAAALDGAAALRRFRTEPRPRPSLVPAPLEPVEITDVALVDLMRFFDNPAREFLKERLQVGITYEQDEIPDDLPIALDSLEKWAVGDRLVTRALDGVPLDRAATEVSRGGLLPPQPLPSPLGEIWQNVQRIVTALPEGEWRSYDISLTVPLPTPANQPVTQVRVTGVVPHVVGDEIQIVTYSSVSAKHVVQAWVYLLALAAAYPDRPWRAAVRGKKQSATLSTPDDAVHDLAGLVLERAHGLRSPLPYPVKTSMVWNKTYQQRLAHGAAPADAARSADRVAKREWEGNKFPGENADPWWQRVFESSAASYADLTARPLFRGRSSLLWVPLLKCYSEKTAGAYKENKR